MELLEDMIAVLLKNINYSKWLKSQNPEASRLRRCIRLANYPGLRNDKTISNCRYGVMTQRNIGLCKPYQCFLHDAVEGCAICVPSWGPRGREGKERLEGGQERNWGTDLLRWMFVNKKGVRNIYLVWLKINKAGSIVANGIHLIFSSSHSTYMKYTHTHTHSERVELLFNLPWTWQRICPSRTGAKQGNFSLRRRYSVTKGSPYCWNNGSKGPIVCVCSALRCGKLEQFREEMLRNLSCFCKAILITPASFLWVDLHSGMTFHH